MNRILGSSIWPVILLVACVSLHAGAQEPFDPLSRSPVERPETLNDGCAATSDTRSYAQYITPGWAAGTRQGHFLVGADTQYPRIDVGDGGHEDAAESERRLRLAFAKVASMRDVGYYVPMFINGDLTEFGHGRERRPLQALFPLMNGRASGPLFLPGLGNHDYENNVGDCANNGCARDSVCDIVKWVREIYPTSAHPVNVDWKFSDELLRGSLSYSVTIGRLHFIQLNNYPAYSTSFKSHVELGFLDEVTYQIDRSVRWLEGDLREARKAGLIIFINMHKRLGWSTGDYDSKIKALVEGYGVSAIFAGHHHAEQGFYPTSRFGSVPVFQTGALTNGALMRVDYNVDAQSADVRAITSGGDRLVRTIPLIVGHELPTTPIDFSDSEIVFYEGNSGYQNVVCNVPIGTNNIRFSMKQYGCSNDEARSLRIMKAKRDTFISVYGNYDQNGNQGYATIEVINDILLPETISSFDKSVTSENWKIIKYGPEGLDGSISSAWVRPYNSTTNGYATFMEHEHLNGNVVCTEMLSPDRNWNLGGGCANDEISSVILHQARAGMNVCLFGNWDMKENEGFTCIQARVNFNHLGVHSLDINATTDTYKIYHYGGRINGKVSSIKIDYIPLAEEPADPTPIDAEVGPVE